MEETIRQIKDLYDKYKKFTRIAFLIVFVISWLVTINNITSVMAGKKISPSKQASNYAQPDGTLALQGKNYAKEMNECKKGPICFIKNYFKVKSIGKDVNHDFNEITHRLREYD